MTAIIVAVFYGTLHDAISSLNSASGRLDTMAGSIGEIKGTLVGIQTQVAKIDTINQSQLEVRQSLLEIRNFNAAIDQQLKSMRPYEVRLIESFGIKVDDNLVVQVENGRVMAFPLTDTKKSQLVAAKFMATDTYLTQPRAMGYVPPSQSLMR